ncbi:unnamed protein product [Closterium sp. NIES-64]|nr:unnamed protein product [Closterium sp. NIES-64]
MPVLHSVLWETPWLPVSRQDYFRPDGRYLFITGSRDYCAGVKHFHLSLTCLIAEAAYLNRTLILDMTQCVNAWHSGGMHHIRSIHVYYDLDSLRDAPLTPLQGLFEGGSGSPFLPFPPSAPLNQGYALDAVTEAFLRGIGSGKGRSGRPCLKYIISSPFRPFSPHPTPLSHPPRLPFFPPRTVPFTPLQGFLRRANEWPGAGEAGALSNLTVPFTPLQGFLRGAREWQVQERRAGRDGAIRARVVDERAPMAALAADGATPVVIRETNYGFSTCKVGGNGCRWVRLSVGGAGGGYPCACGGCAYGRGWSYSSGYPRNNGCRWAELGVSKTAIWFRPELLALAANISPPPTPPSSPPPTSPLQRQDTPAGVSETAIRFRPELLALAANISASMNGGDFDAVHVRRGDKLRPEFWPHLDHDTRPDA